MQKLSFVPPELLPPKLRKLHDDIAAIEAEYRDKEAGLFDKCARKYPACNDFSPAMRIVYKKEHAIIVKECNEKQRGVLGLFCGARCKACAKCEEEQ